MNGIELTRFDQPAILLSSFCGLALIRERQVLPFVIVVLGAVFQGSPVSWLIAALVVWHRMERKADKWTQFKDIAGFFFLLAGSMTPEPGRSLFMFSGVLLVSTGLGGPASGTLPALLFLRQYHPNPEFLEVALAGHALYWILVEVSRWTRIPREHQVLVWSGLVGSAMILSGFKTEVLTIASDPATATAGAAIFVLFAAVSVWIKLRPSAIVSYLEKLRPSLEGLLFWGGRWVSGREPWSAKEATTGGAGFEGAISSTFWWLIVLLSLSLLVGVVFRGGVF
jgi:hypothetical protein